MPSYNTADYIGESIQSVLKQTYTCWELIIVDDCSTDKTDEVVASFINNDVRIKYIKNTKNSGAAVSRNRALKEAKGKWIAFLDSDDLWSPDKLKKQISFMKFNNYHFSYTNYVEIDEKSEFNGVLVTGPKKITKVSMYRYCWPGCLTVMYDADYVGPTQIVNIRKNNDYAMWLKVVRKSDCFLLSESLGMYRRGRFNSISSHNKISLLKWHYTLFRKADNKNVLFSIFLTIQNVIFGLYKKIRYTKRLKR